MGSAGQCLMDRLANVNQVSVVQLKAAENAAGRFLGLSPRTPGFLTVGGRRFRKSSFRNQSLRGPVYLPKQTPGEFGRTASVHAEE